MSCMILFLKPFHQRFIGTGKKPEYVIFRCLPPLYGIKNRGEILFLAKKQWMNFEGLPETYLFYFDKPVNYDHSFGLQAYNDRQSCILNTSLNQDFHIFCN